jgi:hypothetical protein
MNMAVDQMPEGMQKCPFCAEIIRSEAKICRFCQRDLPPEPNAKSEIIELPREFSELRYGDRVCSPTMGDGTVVDTPFEESVRVVFDLIRPRGGSQPRT